MSSLKQAFESTFELVTQTLSRCTWAGDRDGQCVALACWGLQLMGTLGLRLWHAQVGRLAGPQQQLLTHLHRFFGQAVYALLLTSCATGLQSRQSSDMYALSAPTAASQRPAGVCVLLVALGVSTYAALAYLPVKARGV